MIESAADSPVADAVLGFHIFVGVVALLAGVGAILTRKGGRRHNTAGKLYVVTMGAVVVTAIPLAAWTTNWFLLAIAVFSGYLVFGGYRVVTRRRADRRDPTVVDYLGHGSMVTVGSTMISVGGWQTATGSPGLAPALAVFGAIGAGLAISMLLQFRHPRGERAPWIRSHIAFMGGAYLSTVTATVTVNLTMIPPLVRWLGPTVLGVPLIVYATSIYRRSRPSASGLDPEAVHTPRFASGG